MKKREKKEKKGMKEEKLPQDKKQESEKPKAKPKPKTIEEKYQDALKEIDELKKKRMYLQAEMENGQKIALKRIENSKYNSKVNVIRNFLPIVDSFEAAISKYQSSSKKDFDQLLDGIKSLEKQFLLVLKGLGIKPIEQLYIPFNYKEHDVFMRLIDEEQPEDTVIKIAQKGYYLGENVLRPAKVIVSKKKDKPKAILVEAEVIDVKEIASENEKVQTEVNTTTDVESPESEDTSKTDYIS